MRSLPCLPTSPPTPPSPATPLQIRDLRATIIERVMPALAYNHPNMFAMPTHDDAFDIAMREIEKRILRKGGKGVKGGRVGNTDDAEE